MAFAKKAPIVIGQDEAERTKLGWKSGESITIKASVTTQDIDAVAHADKIGRSTQVTLERFIQNWVLFNDENMPVNLSPEAIALLDVEYVIPVSQRIEQLMNKVLPAQALQNFTSAATKPSSVS